MSELFEAEALSDELIRRLASLADVPFEHDAFVAAAESAGFKVLPRESWEGEQPILRRIKIRSKPPELLALWDDFERSAGLVIAAVTDTIEGVSKEVIDQFNVRFEDQRDRFIDLFGSPTAQGSYQSRLKDFTGGYVLFARQHSTFVLMQHDEGDGHYGHYATLDIRILPQVADKIRFPMISNLMF